MPPLSKTDPDVVEDIEDLDVDDLDDFVSGFNKPAEKPTGTNSQLPTSSAKPAKDVKPDNPLSTDAVNPDLDQVDFEAELSKGMETLLKELGMDPDSAAGLQAGASASSASTGDANTQGPPGGQPSLGADGMPPMDPEMKELFSKLFSGDMEGMEGLDELLKGMGGGDAAGVSGLSSTAGPTNAGLGDKTMNASGEKLSFQETIDRTMKNLKSSSDQANQASNQSSDPLLSLLSQLSQDPSLASLANLSKDFDKNGGEEAGSGQDEKIGNALDVMMRQLMTREILQEPLEDLSQRYPEYLKAQHALPDGDQGKINATQLEAYSKQNKLIKEMVALFKSPGYSDQDEQMKEKVYKLMCEMQELGSPPDEVMGELPEGFGMGDDACTIM